MFKVIGNKIYMNYTNIFKQEEFYLLRTCVSNKRAKEIAKQLSKERKEKVQYELGG